MDMDVNKFTSCANQWNEIKDKLSGIMMDKINTLARRNRSSDKITAEIKSTVV
jgi:hypothetical protein